MYDAVADIKEPKAQYYNSVMKLIPALLRVFLI
jgi:hypothetical protein